MTTKTSEKLTEPMISVTTGNTIRNRLLRTLCSIQATSGAGNRNWQWPQSRGGVRAQLAALCLSLILTACGGSDPNAPATDTIIAQPIALVLRPGETEHLRYQRGEGAFE
jgi:hypothetical protein